ncbi:MAG: 23S rRNA (pseudouridine(1915)-N(3))-methyltransferase RlmH, partial [Rhodospirillaceae bacterium]|nr:23S rRNA (pseudouridine(1915)-N(3))-methyltransferase RlmH [Rhodospirillaceae bacterium]
MQYTIVAIGKMRSSVERDLLNNFSERIRPKPLVIEVEEKRNFSSAELKAREGELLISALPAGAKIIALDENGKSLSSRKLATLLGSWSDEGVRETAFIIGGADGLDENVRKKADLTLSLGAMTWPHMMVRGMVAEQIYRAQSILSG